MALKPVRVRKRSILPAGRSADPTIRRARRARRALVSYRHDSGLTDADGLDTAIADLICDLLHLCNRSGLDCQRVLARARMHYDAETRGA